VKSGRGSFLWGVELAKWWLPDLRTLPDQRITLHLSRDAFAVRDEGNTIAERIALGMDAVFGSESTYLAQPSCNHTRTAQQIERCTLCLVDLPRNTGREPQTGFGGACAQCLPHKILVIGPKEVMGQRVNMAMITPRPHSPL
jgi:hypothetical protein